MGFCINVDIGGTFTDFFAKSDDRNMLTKVPTTHYNLSVGFTKGVRELARMYGLDFNNFLEQVP